MQDLKLALLILSMVCCGVQAAEDGRRAVSEKVWAERLKPDNFADRTIIDSTGQSVIRIRAPEWVDDPTTAPISIKAGQPQTDESYINQIWLFIDRNPLPLVGRFELTPDSGRADMAMKVRVNDASYIRVIAETSSGDLYMDKAFMRTAGGGCSAPPGAGMEESMKKRGQMRVRLLGDVTLAQPVLTQIRIRHPNVTGLSLDVETRNRPPAYFLNELKVEYNGDPIIQGNMTFALSRDPTLRFYFQPDRAGKLRIIARDTKQQKYVSSHPVNMHAH